MLPPLGDSIDDKLILLRAVRRAMPMPTDSPEQRDAFKRALAAELPAFVHWLLKWEIPIELRSSRFGITHFHHPALVAVLNDLAPERRLLQLIDMEILSNGERPPWEGTAAELEERLTRADGARAREVRQLLNFPNACGSYLARLAGARAPRVEKHRSGHERRWKILPRD